MSEPIRRWGSLRIWLLFFCVYWRRKFGERGRGGGEYQSGREWEQGSVGASYFSSLHNSFLPATDGTDRAVQDDRAPIPPRSFRFNISSVILQCCGCSLPRGQEDWRGQLWYYLRRYATRQTTTAGSSFALLSAPLLYSVVVYCTMDPFVNSDIG